MLKLIKKRFKFDDDFHKSQLLKRVHTLKKFINELSGTSGTEVAVEDLVGSRRPSITFKLGTASSSANSVLQIKYKDNLLIRISNYLQFNRQKKLDIDVNVSCMHLRKLTSFTLYMLEKQ